MPSPYELAVLAHGAYELLKPNEPFFQLPEEWYVVHRFPAPPGSWDVGAVIYERIIKIEKEQKLEIKGMVKPFISTPITVERVIAFRGTKPSSIWNWISNFGLFFNQHPISESVAKNVEYEMKDRLRSPLQYQEIQERKIPENYKQKLLELMKAGQSLKLNVSRTTYTGHSAGASAAILRACQQAIVNSADVVTREAIIQAVVFDSAGSLLKNKEEIKWANGLNRYGEPNVTSYLTAPNVVNTLHPHVGKVYRLYVHHTQGDLRFMNSLVSVLEATARYVITPLIMLGVYVDKEWKPDVSNNKKITTACIQGLISIYICGMAIKLGPGAYFNFFWFLNQHNIDNIVACFDRVSKQPKWMRGKPNGDEIKASWPSFREHNVENRLARLGFFPIPIINRGPIDVVSVDVAERTLEFLSTL